VALPKEHGGWSFTLEPVALGLLVAPSWPGAALGAVALLGFLARTPVKLYLVDRQRSRRLARTRLAKRIGAVELALAGVIFAVAWATAAAVFWWPLAVAVPLIGLELWYDMRSRSRSLVPELAGSIGIGAVAAAIALADGATTAVAAGLWSVAAARAVAAVPFVRLQLRRLKRQPHNRLPSHLAQLVALAVVVIAAILSAAPVAAVIAVTMMVLVHVVLAYLPPSSVPVLGAGQVVIGLTVVLTTALGALAQFG
jgi:hypothetical protein